MIVNQPESKELKKLMNEMAVVSTISVTNEKLATYISKNYMKTIFMTAGQLADKVGVSQGSVTRFCINLKYKGYNDFVHALQNMVRKEITLPQRLEYTNNGDEEDIKNILDTEHSNIDFMNNIIKTESYHKLKEKIAKSKNIVLISARMSATILPYTFYVLNKIRNNVIQVTPDSPMWDTLNLLDPESTLILTFVFPRYCNLLLQKLKVLKETGYEIIAVTDTDFLVTKGFVDSYISIPITASSIFDIYSTPILFINLLLRDVAKEIDGLDERIAKLEKMEIENNIYYKDE